MLSAAANVSAICAGRRLKSRRYAPAVSSAPKNAIWRIRGSCGTSARARAASAIDGGAGAATGSESSETTAIPITPGCMLPFLATWNGEVRDPLQDLFVPDLFVPDLFVQAFFAQAFSARDRHGKRRSVRRDCFFVQDDGLRTLIAGQAMDHPEMAQRLALAAHRFVQLGQIAMRRERERIAFGRAQEASERALRSSRRR